MITLNLLPSIQKEKIKKMAIYSVLENIVAGIFITLSLVGIIFLVAQNVLQNNLAYFSNNKIAVVQNEQALNYKIKTLNTKLKNISEIQKDYNKWSSLLININELIPNDISLTYLEILKKDEGNILIINGKAKKRADLLTFKENLENYPKFTKVDSPISNILQKENLTFSIEIELTK